jgi:hypothetical protein
MMWAFGTGLKEELIEFKKVAPAEQIGDCLNPESRAYTVAMPALAWIEGFIVFLDDYLLDYSIYYNITHFLCCDRKVSLSNKELMVRM